jgi:proteasome accessory factor A
MIEDGVVFRDLTLENPIRPSGRSPTTSTCRRKVRLANGRELSALDIQWEYLDRVMRFARVTRGSPPRSKRALDRWEHLLTGLEKDPMTLDREVDWVIKYKLLEQYRMPALPAGRRPAVDARFVLSRREPHRGIYYMLAGRDKVDRIVTDAADREGDRRAPTDDPGPPTRRVHQGGQGESGTSPSTGCT